MIHLQSRLLIRVQGFPRGFLRFQSTARNPKVKRRSIFKDLLKTPTTKSLLLTIVFGSTVTEMISRRRKLEALREGHQTRMQILQDILHRLRKGENVDLQQELNLLNKISPEDANIEIELDEKILELFKEMDTNPPGTDDIKVKHDSLPDVHRSKIKGAHEQTNTKDFL